VATLRSRSEALLSSSGEPLTLACALEVEERAARRAGARAARVGLRASQPLPDTPLVSFGLAGALVPGLEPGELVTAERVVDEWGRVLWEGEPVAIEGAIRGVVCATPEILDDPASRQALAERTGALVVDMESGALAASGRLTGVVRAISDSHDQPLGPLAFAANVDGSTRWSAVAFAFLFHPVASLRTALSARRAINRLERAAEALR
jgi:adenosylhomocysteine nucleosidase